MKKLLLLFLLPLGALAQNPTMPGVGLVFGSNNPGGGGGSGPYSPSSFTANAVLLGNGTGAIQSSGITSTAGGSGFTAAASTDLTLNAGSGAPHGVIIGTNALVFAGAGSGAGMSLTDNGSGGGTWAAGGDESESYAGAERDGRICPDRKRC